MFSLLKRNLFLLIVCLGLLEAQHSARATTVSDTLRLQSGSYFVLEGNVYAVKSDTLVIVEKIDAFARISKDEYLYRRLQNKGSNSRLGNELVKLTLNPVNQAVKKQDTDLTNSTDDFIASSGKIIRKIRIKKLDVIGADVYDTLPVKSTAAGNFINKIHIQTRNSVIRENLFFSMGDTLNPWLLADNEKHFRDMRSIENAHFYLSPVGPDSVDIVVVTRDNIPYGVFPVIVSADKQRLKIWNSNFLGYGHELGGSLARVAAEKPPLYLSELYYKISNLSQSFTDLYLTYNRSKQEKYIDFRIARPYIPAVVNLAGGLDLTMHSFELPFWLSPANLTESATYLDGNAWIGYYHQKKDATEKQARPFGLIPAVGIYNKYFQDRPFTSADSNYFLSNYSTFLASFSVVKQEYLQTTKLFEQGLQQDVPSGFAGTLTAGYQVGEYYQMPYFGLDVLFAKAFKRAGYFNGYLRFGTHIHQQKMTQGAFMAGLTHITNIESNGSARFRVFTGLYYSLGINRLSYDSLYLRNGSGIVGLRTDYFRGMQRANAIVQLLYYAPWTTVGFSFTPYIDLSGGFVGTENGALFNSRFISGIGFGVRMRNKYLVFSSIQLRLMYFPFTPSGVAPWAVDVSDITDFPLNDFRPGAPAYLQFR